MSQTAGGPVSLGRPIIRLGETESTNDIARYLARAGVTEGAVVVADRQTRGRGRLGRPWASPKGGLWCSVLLRPDDCTAVGLLSLAVGVAVTEAVEMVSGVQAGVKWPNDVVVRDRKLAGILLETAGPAVIAGIGVNIAVDDFGEDLARRAVSLHTIATIAAPPEARDTLLEQMLDRLAFWYRTWQSESHRIVEAWRSKDTTHGRPVVLRVADETLGGMAAGIDDDGALRLRLPDGAIRRVLAGDLQPEGVTAAEA